VDDLADVDVNDSPTIIIKPLPTQLNLENEDTNIQDTIPSEILNATLSPAVEKVSGKEGDEDDIQKVKPMLSRKQREAIDGFAKWNEDYGIAINNLQNVFWAKFSSLPQHGKVQEKKIIYWDMMEFADYVSKNIDDKYKAYASENRKKYPKLCVKI